MYSPADAAISEGGPGKFEINLMHHDDPLRAADDAYLFKMLIKGLARRNGFAASFMAKPYLDQPGSGLHMHFSVLDQDGNNVFDDGSDQGTDTLRHAVQGCLQAMADCTLIFAPHANSYARLVPDAHAPTGIGWGYENRTAAIRIPGGPAAARRIEHRVAGGDVNPYLMACAVLGAALNGIEDAAEPPAPITGNAYEADLPQIPGDWATAIDRFENSPVVARIFPAELIRNLVMTKRQELRIIGAQDADAQARIYLEMV
jgi:glutamine synthetase